MKNGAKNVLFLCTGNSARSILAEALMERSGPPRYRGFSAGSQPKSAPHSVALAILADKGYATQGMRSKSWDEFAEPASREFDLVITVCDDAAGESCPIWPGAPIRIHWGLEDPASFEGSSDAIRQRFERTYTDLEARIEALLALDPLLLGRDEFARRLAFIGQDFSR